MRSTFRIDKHGSCCDCNCGDHITQCVQEHSHHIQIVAVRVRFGGAFFAVAVGVRVALSNGTLLMQKSPFLLHNSVESIRFSTRAREKRIKTREKRIKTREKRI